MIAIVRWHSGAAGQLLPHNIRDPCLIQGLNVQSNFLYTEDCKCTEGAEVGAGGNSYDSGI